MERNERLEKEERVRYVKEKDNAREAPEPSMPHNSAVDRNACTDSMKNNKDRQNFESSRNRLKRKKKEGEESTLEKKKKGIGKCFTFQGVGKKESER